MKNLVVFAAITMLSASISGVAQTSAKSPVVVELFTSEGCSSCPPADALLMELDQNASGKTPEVIVLGEHVDYWNSIGWTDRFSSAAFSKRQADYVSRFHLATAYTPQMVIDGGTQLSGNNRSGVYHTIQLAAAAEKPARVSLAWAEANRLHVTVQLAASSKAQVLLAITEGGLSTSVRGGENGGRTLHHAGVVRQLRAIGTTDNGRLETSVEIPRTSDWNAANLRAVVIVQQPGQGPILGASSIPFAR